MAKVLPGLLGLGLRRLLVTILLRLVLVHGDDNVGHQYDIGQNGSQSTCIRGVA